MASFSRSFRSPSYLSPRMRPSMPGRTVSNSSDRSFASDGGDEASDRGATSGRTTPIHGIHRYGASTGLHSPGSAPVVSNSDSSRATSSTSSSSRPISIELPRINRISSAPVYTPPEPLSARGDLPGGYFPLHEDPKDRIHRPHPFRNDRKAVDCRLPKESEEATHHSGRPNLPHPASTSAMTYSNAQVTSYFPTGYGDNQLPMGKYYPTNYENRQKAQASAQASGSSSEAPKSPAVAASPGTSPSEVEIRRRMQLQQYQRDMIAQASLAANQVLGASAHGKGGNSRTNGGSNTLRIPTGRDGRLGLSIHKPTAPRLHPLGSPGPVTPMELSESGGSYLDKGQGSASPFDT